MRKQKKYGKFTVVVEQDEDGFFVASVPALPGCSTQARTFQELKKRLYEAIRLCMEVAHDNPSYMRQIRQFGYEPSFVGMEIVQV